jgi:hypothetical protein
MTFHGYRVGIDLERVVQLTHRGRRFTFRVERDPPLAFWSLECEKGINSSPLRILGDGEPSFFVALADLALKNGFDS